MSSTMLRLTTNRSLYAFFFPFQKIGDEDRINNELKQPEIIEIESLSPGEIGIDRLKHMFHDRNGNISNEVQSIVSATVTGVIGGFIYGGVAKTKDIPTNFIRENQATKWESTFYAKRQLHNKFALEFFKKGTRIGLSAGIFCFLFQSTSVMMYVYRGKFEIINCTAAGALTGGLFKIDMGLKGTMAGTIIGSLLGSMYGAVAKLLLYITGAELSDLYEIHFQLMQKRRDNLKYASTTYMNNEIIELREKYVENKLLQEAAKSQEKLE
ncbi:RPII140-upstream gene protein isoform X1 [Megalopta genalis]|uniref:RPII140-upstream gene protein isoform X1 n=2 Tax=Megalopta genalis TaxID=115081 RepID=UPI003FD4EED5